MIVYITGAVSRGFGFFRNQSDLLGLESNL